MPDQDKTSQADLSLPADIKFKIGERNFIAKRVTLGLRLKLSGFFAKILTQVIPDGVKVEEMDNIDAYFGLILKRLPYLLQQLEVDYQDVVLGCTNIQADFLEESCEIEDIINILKAIFIANRFDKTMAALRDSSKKK